jgi:hypothetical protein
MRFIAGLASLCLLLAPALAGGATLSRDPLFGLPYTAASIHFEPAPADLAQTCHDLVNARWDRRLWIFAKAAQGDDVYLVVGGFYVARKAGTVAGKSSAVMKADALGAIAHIEGATCTLAGPAREVFDYGDPTIDAPTLRLLAADAMSRYAKAYGGKRQLAAQLRRHGMKFAGPNAAILRDAVKTLEAR